MGTYLHPVCPDPTLELIAQVPPGTAARYRKIEEALLDCEVLPLDMILTQLGHQFGQSFRTVRSTLEEARDTDPDLSRFHDFRLAGFGKLTLDCRAAIRDLGLGTGDVGSARQPHQIAALLEAQGVSLPTGMLHEISEVTWA